MRFHHSTRRGRNRLGQHSQHLASNSHRPTHHSTVSTSRWSLLSYCRDTNIHFNRRIPVEPPAPLRGEQQQLQFQPQLQPQLKLTNGHQYRSTSDLRGPAAAEALETPADTVSLRGQLGAKLALASSPASPSKQRATAAAASKQREEANLRKTNSQQQRDLADRLNKLSLEGRQSPRASRKQQQQQARRQEGGQRNDEFALDSPRALDLESARAKLIAQVEKHPFWSNKAAKRMQLTNIEHRRIYIYELISFCERRELEWRYEPYRGGLIASAAPFRRAAAAEGVTGCSWSQPATPTGRGKLAPAPLPIAVPLWQAGGGGGLRGSGLQQARAPSSSGRPPLSLPATVTGSGDSSFWNGGAGSGSGGSGASVARSAGGGEAGGAVAKQMQRQQQQRVGSALCGREGGVAALTPPLSGGSLASGRSQIRRSVSSSSPGAQRDYGLVSPAPTPVPTPTPMLPAYRASEAAATAPATSGGSPSGYWSPQAATTASAANLLAAEQCLPSPALVWSIEPPAQVRPEPFSGCVHVCELPDSSFVKRCHGCQGRGKLKCTSCYGVGYEVCLGCSGKGTTKSLGAAHGARSGGLHSSEHHSSRSASRAGGGGGGFGSDNDHDHDGGGSGGGLFGASLADSNSRWRGGAGEPGGITSGSGGGAWVSESCHYCHGAGQKRCWVCAGKSYNYCLGCAGSGQLRCYLNLNISWLNHRDESVLNNADNVIPRERLRLSSGELSLDESASRLEPVARARLDSSTRRPEESNQLHSASKKLLDKHWLTYGQQERLMRQRHRLTQIECHVVSYEWKKRRGSFVVYGAERKVYIAKYPFKSFCSIT